MSELVPATGWFLIEYIDPSERDDGDRYYELHAVAAFMLEGDYQLDDR